jgi:hypothetical protein
MFIYHILLLAVSDTFLMSLQCTVQQIVTIFRSLFWLTGLNIRNTNKNGVSAVKWHLIFVFYFSKPHLLIGLPDKHHIPVILTGNSL